MARMPSVTGSVVDVNSSTIALTGDSRKLIRHKSDARATMNATAYDGASINYDTCIIKNSGYTKFGTTQTFYAVNSGVFRFFAEDSNGNSDAYDYEAEMIPYVELNCNANVASIGADGSVKVACTGSFYSGSFGSRYNSLTLEFRVKPSGGSYSSWISLSPSINSYTNTYSVEVQISGYFGTYDAGAVEFRATDQLSMSACALGTVVRTPIFHWSGDDFVFEVPVTFKQGFTGGSSDSGGSSSGGSSSGGSSGVEYGSWTPSLYSGAISSYTTRRGWYSKTGNVVTVGFLVKARCYSGYDDTSIEISGLPYTPDVSASGGGICSNACVPDGYAFECFVAEVGEDIITTRMQCIGTDGWSNLTTTASGCCYRKNGGEITLSGTIAYVTEDDSGSGDKVEIFG